MTKLYFLWALFLLVTVGYANHTGWSLLDSLFTGQWRHHAGVGRGFHAK